MPTVSQHQRGAFTEPVDGNTLAAAVVLGNDNDVRGAHNDHDADGTIHVQSSALASRPAAGVLGRKWVTTDGLRFYLDDGSSWDELAYLSLAAGGTVAASTTFSAGLVTTTLNVQAAADFGSGITVSAGNLAVSSGTFAVTGNSTLDGNVIVGGSGDSIGFYGASVQTKQEITGSKGANAALTSLIDALELLGLITDSTS